MRFLAGRRSWDSGRPPIGVVLANVGMACLVFTRVSQSLVPPRRLLLRYSLPSLSGRLECSLLLTDEKRACLVWERRRERRPRRWVLHDLH